MKRYAKVPRNLLEADVSDAAVRLYALLALNIESVDELAQRLGKTTTTVRKHLRELLDANAVEVTTVTRQVVTARKLEA